MLVSAETIEVNREPHMLGFCFDVTERKQAEADLLRTLAREKELGQLRSNFVSMVSHEFRTPLGIIQSSAEILKDYLDQLEPTERNDHLQSIRKNTRRMAGLMEEVLLLGSLDAGRMELGPAHWSSRHSCESSWTMSCRPLTGDARSNCLSPECQPRSRPTSVYWNTSSQICYRTP
jgi:signal transduction histidine kinase